MTEATQTNYIEIRKTRGGDDKPYIAGTRIGIDTIYVCHELRGMTSDEIIAAYPHLSLAQVHAALVYFFEHPKEIKEQVRQDREYAERLEAEQGPTKFTRLRDALLGSTDAPDDSLPS